MDKLNSRMDGAEERHGKLGDKAAGIVQTEHKEKMFWEEHYRVSRTYKKSQMSMSSESWKDRRKKEGLKNIQKYSGW